MAPLTHPDMVNPLIADFLRDDRRIDTSTFPLKDASIG